MLQHQPGIARKALLQHNQRAVIADAQRYCVEGYRLALQRDMDARAHSQENAVAAAALFSLSSLRSGLRTGLS